MDDGIVTAPKARRRISIWRAQFSLRWLLGLTTVTALALGGWLKIIEPFKFQASAAQVIAAAGGNYRTRNVAPDWLRYIATWRVVNHFDVIRDVELPPEATLSCADLLPQLTWLEKLTVSGAAFGDKHLIGVGRHSELGELTLRGTTVTAAAVHQLQNQRPELKLTVAPLDISAQNDPRVAELIGRAFDRSRLTPHVRGLDGSRVSITDLMFPTSRQAGLRRFALGFGLL